MSARALACALGLWLAAAVPAAAHSLVERSVPAANSALDRAPRQVELRFNEPVDASFSTATVTDPAGARVSGPPALSADGRTMIVPLEDLPHGFYTVRWRALSTTDGHTTSGVFAFTVGLGARPPEQFGGLAGPDLLLAVVRWAGFVAVTLLVGAVLFPWLVLEPGLRRLDPIEALRLDLDAAARLRVVVVISAAAVVIAAAAEILVRVLALTEASLRDVVAGGHLWVMATGTNPGWAAVIRVAMAALLLLPSAPWGRLLRAAGLSWFVLLAGIVMLFGGPAALAGSDHLALVVLVGAVYGIVGLMLAIILPQIPDIRLPELAAVRPMAAGLLLLGVTLNSHAWGSGPLAAAADWLHLLAAAVWIGGLACLLVILVAPREDRAILAPRLVPRFSGVAAAGLAVMAATGVYAAWLHVPHLDAFTATSYGRYLGVKLLLVVPLVALGAVNRFLIRPRLAGGPTAPDPAPPVGRFLGLGGAEAAVAAGILVVVALLTATPPARVSLATSTAAQALRLAGLDGDVRFALDVEPARPGPNRFEVTVTTGDGAPPDEDARVLVRLTKLDEELGPATHIAAGTGAGRYAVEGVVLPEGWWEVEVLLRRRGVLDASTRFPLRLGPAGAAPEDATARGLLEASAAAMAAAATWREEDQISDGSGGLVVTSLELVRPDRIRARTSTGVEVVFVGATRYLREGTGPWHRAEMSRPIAADGALQYLRAAARVARGRRVPCGAEACRVIMWESPDGEAAFAGWIGEATRRLHRLLMVAPQHYMTGRLFDFDTAIHVEPPE